MDSKVTARPKLSISIPTYNRAGTLREQLWNVCTQIELAGLPWQVVVSDNHSDDATPDVVREVASRFASIKYERNPENIGMLRNIDAAVRVADADYVWLLGDDDIVMPYTVQMLADCLAQHAPSKPFAFACLNAFALTSNGTAITSVNDQDCFLCNTVFEHGADIFKHVGYVSLGHLSRLVVNRGMWAAKDYKEREPWEVYSFIRLLIYMSKEGPTLWFSPPLVGARNKHSVSYYGNHLAPAYAIEFKRFDLLLSAAGERFCPPIRRRHRGTNCRAFFKLAVFDSAYQGLFTAIPQNFLFGSERVAYWVARLLVRGTFIGNFLQGYWSKRMKLPIEQDKTLLRSV